MGELVLVAGVTSRLGRAVAAELVRRGYAVRGLSRGASPALPQVELVRGDCLREDLGSALQGVTRVFSCVGASVQPSLGLGRASFHQVDLPANLNLLRAAEQAGAEHFAYVSVAGHAHTRHLLYVDAHEQVVEALQRSALGCSVVRPTGFFSALEAMLPMAKFGVVPLLGSGEALSNPIADSDLALLCCDAVEGKFRELSVGGPETLSRRRIAELAFEAWDKAARTPRAPAFFSRASAWWLRPINPRVSDLLRFYAHVMTHDCVAEARGAQTLGAHFLEKAASQRPKLLES